MAFTLVKETFNQDYGDSLQGKGGKRIYLVVSDTKILNNDAVLDAAGIPGINDSWSLGKLDLKVVRRRVKEIDNGKTFFSVEIDYETPLGTGVAGSDDPDPTIRPWAVSSTTDKLEENVEKTTLSVIGSGLGDIELGLNKSIVTAASDPIEVRGYRRRTILSLSKNYLKFSDIDPAIVTLGDLKEYEGKLNDDTESIGGITGDKWEFLVDEINAVNARENEIDYIKVTYRVVHDPETHIKILLNAGLNRLDPNDKTKRIPVLNKGVPVKKPAMLDISGQPIPAADPAAAVATGTYIAAGINKEIDVSTLGLPETFN